MLYALLDRARAASQGLAEADRDGALIAMAESLLDQAAAILSANEKDVAAERERGTSAALLDRLKLDMDRLHAIAAAVRHVAGLADPVGRVLDGRRLGPDLEMRQVTVPFGVIAMVYESRPNVTVDAAALVVKAGSAAVLRGSASALASNRAIVRALRAGLVAAGVNTDAVQLVDSADREHVTSLLAARGKVDLVIPRGGESLIRHVVENARVPVIETGIGNCHVYVDSAADLDAAIKIVHNAKLQRPGVCNAAETLLVHADVAGEFLPLVEPGLRSAGVELRACERASRMLSGSVAASERDWQTEFLDLTLAVRVVDSADEAIAHIGRYGSQHSEAIVTRDAATARRFQQRVDAAVVYVNASTRFTDGFEFGLGAEIGISTQKLHARGPMGLAAMVTSKYLVEGEGTIRS